MFAFMDGLDSDIKQSLLNQLRDIWTHTSTAIEGNTLTLGDTKFILEEGLTVSGKPIKDHEEVIGHAKAIELIYSMIGREITENDLFDLHKAIQTEHITDIYKPNGGWKVEPNGTYMVDEMGQQKFVEYAKPASVPALMTEIIKETHKQSHSSISLDRAPEIYSKIHAGIAHTHPFWDGNGRIARLVANIPVLSSGLPPIVIPKEARREYIELLSRYQQEVGEIDRQTGVWPSLVSLKDFTDFCSASYSATIKLVDQARDLQEHRNRAGS